MCKAGGCGPGAAEYNTAPTGPWAPLAGRMQMIPILDIKRMHAEIAPELESAVLEVVRSTRYILGPDVTGFEKEIAAYLGVEDAVGVSNGTDALVVALTALDLGPGDEVITTPFTFIATAEAILRVGATPVFVDVNPDTLLIDPEQVAARVTSRTRCILPVHLFGQIADMDKLAEIAGPRGIHLVEDVAQAMGATWGTRQAGSMGSAGCFSFFPSKNLGGLGDGGLVTCPTKEFADRVRRIRAHGAAKKYYHETVGGNYRLDAIQAAALSVKLTRLDKWNLARRERAERYIQLFDARGLIKAHRIMPLGLQSGSSHVYHQFVVRAEDRDGLSAHLTAAGIGNAIYYPVPLHRQPVFKGLSTGEFPVADAAAQQVLALPIFPGLTDAEIDQVVDAIDAYYKG